MNDDVTPGALCDALKAAIQEGGGNLFEPQNIVQLVEKLRKTADLPWTEDLVMSWISGMETPSEAERRLVAACLRVPGKSLFLPEGDRIPGKTSVSKELLRAAKQVEDLKAVVKGSQSKLFSPERFPDRLRFAFIHRDILKSRDDLDWESVPERVRFLIGPFASSDMQWIEDRLPPKEPMLSLLAQSVWVDPEFLAGAGWSKHSVLRH